METLLKMIAALVGVLKTLDQRHMVRLMGMPALQEMKRLCNRIHGEWLADQRALAQRNLDIDEFRCELGYMHERLAAANKEARGYESDVYREKARLNELKNSMRADTRQLCIIQKMYKTGAFGVQTYVMACHSLGLDKITAIKALRAVTGGGLKESKDEVENNELNWEDNRKF